ncbi:MAG: hypothetical protein HGA94_05435, partial [Candidatus Aminicenantes bacterium]|nr:hypothetical protein [Candidatus Aminicenantes bacterium]
MQAFTYAKRSLALASLCLIIIFAAAQQPDPKSAAFDPQRTYPVETLKADLRVLWDILEEGHGGFDRYTPVEAQRKAFEGVEKGLTGPLTEFEFYTRLLPLVAGIKDGHTQLVLSAAAATFLDGATDGMSHRQIILEEMLMLWLANETPAFAPFL